MPETTDKIGPTTTHDSTLTQEPLEKFSTVDTLHNDEALRVIANYSGPTAWTDEEEKELLKKIDRRLLTILCFTFGLQYYDKQMLAQAVRTVLFYHNRPVLNGFHSFRLCPTLLISRTSRPFLDSFRT